ncbi:MULTISPECIES: hypothetical protein [unclassified Tolypothrix]|nr:MULTISPECIES: hypothetical protein [unclassified Tolypothrix]EKE96427.1 hypothetical protein FDUTEX481_09773 [Tolypothrix sp. PCC 7601]MBE9084140.1 hypothetical protein [Tolypothrix sp. LEGE 11397]UYD31067.1 hypothetical protein HGR01_40000 [Tolypothrix sp. PCC 7712]
MPFDHKTKHELNPDDNHKSGRKINDEINLAALVPMGLMLTDKFHNWQK